MQTKGNILGILTVLLWSTLALFTVLTGKIEAFQLTAMSFFVASIIGVVVLKKEGHSFSLLLKLPLKLWALGIYGLFGYHFFYFLALKNAPAIEANLINYLWPLLIVLFSAFLPNEKLRWFHIVGASFGLIGAFILVAKNGSLSFEGQYAKGYMFALVAALAWSSYSVLSRLFQSVPTSSVTGFCIATTILATLCHLSFEVTVMPSLREFLASIALGLGPVGGAFYLWDYAVKNGDIQILGSLAYLAPLLSTLLLVLFGLSTMSMVIALACTCIIIGSIISSKEYLSPLLKRLK